MNPIKIIKKCAKQKLYADWFTHIAVFVGFFAISCAILFGGAACVTLLNRYAHLSEADFALLDSVYAIFVVLCVIPLAYGVLTYAVHVTDGQAADVMDLFCAFGSGKTFCRSFTLLWSLFWRAVLVFALPVYFVSQADILLYEENFLYTDIGGFDVGYFLISTGLFIAFFAAFAFYSHYFAGIYFAIKHENARLSVCFSAAAFARKADPVQNVYVRLCIAFLPLLVLSLFTCGILFLIYTGPLILLAFFESAKRQTATLQVRFHADAFFDYPPLTL